MQAKVSVIIPNYNRAAIVGETIANMLSQTLAPYQVIVVDDGSTDGSVEVIRSFGERVTLIEQKNQGPGAARNAGLQIATGSYIQFMDSDDLASLNKLEVQAEVMHSQNADIVYGPWTKVWKNDQAIQLQDVVLQQSALPSSKTALCWFLTEWSMVFQHCLFKKELFDRVGGFKHGMTSHEDGELFVRLLMAGASLVHEDKTLTFYRLNDFGKLTATGQGNQKRAADQALFYWDVIKQQNNPLLSVCLNSSLFKLRVQNAIKDLEATGLTTTEVYNGLNAFVGKGKTYLNAQLWLNQKSAGLKHRIKGHRWPSCYQTGPLSSQQQQLVNNLGWQITQA